MRCAGWRGPRGIFKGRGGATKSNICRIDISPWTCHHGPAREVGPLAPFWHHFGTILGASSFGPAWGHEHPVHAIDNLDL